MKEEDLVNEISEEPSKSLREKVQKARTVQKRRFGSSGLRTNSEMNAAEIRKYCVMEPEATKLLNQAISRLSLSARSYFKIIKLSQTIADLEGNKTIGISDVSEALQYRVQDE